VVFSFFPGCRTEKNVFADAGWKSPEWGDGKYDRMHFLTKTAEDTMRYELEKSFVRIIIEASFRVSDSEQDVVRPMAYGNGVVIEIPGMLGKYIITNFHVIDCESFRPPNFEVVIKRYLLYKGQKIEIPDSFVVGQKMENDFAVIKLPPDIVIPSLPCLVGKSLELKADDALYGVSHPQNFKNLVFRRGTVADIYDLEVDPQIADAFKMNEDARKISFGGSFLSSLNVYPGDSGGAVFAIRDGKLEYVGIISNIPIHTFNPVIGWNGVGYVIRQASLGLCGVIRIETALDSVFIGR
jgi:S1-C subfamily serine protease